MSESDIAVFVNNQPPSKIASMLAVGSQGVYEWLVTDRQFDLLQICPDVVLGKYVAITSFDSGPLALSDEEKAVGWESRNNIAYSPKIQDAASVPRSEYDEWYIFGGPVDLGTTHLEENVFEVQQEPGHVNVLVNYGFALHPPGRARLANLFWPQMERIRPESYVADNDYVTFVSADKALFVSVLDAVKGDPIEQGLPLISDGCVTSSLHSKDPVRGFEQVTMCQEGQRK